MLALDTSGACWPSNNLEGHGDLVSGLILGIIGVIKWLLGVINLLAKSA